MLEPVKTIVVLRNVERERMAFPVVPVRSVKPYGAMLVFAKTIVTVGSAGLRRSWKSCAGRAPIDPGVIRGSAKTIVVQRNVERERTASLVVLAPSANLGLVMKVCAKTIVMGSNAVSRPYWM